MSSLGSLLALFGIGLSASWYKPSKHKKIIKFAKGRPTCVPAGSPECKAARKGISGVPRGYSDAIGVNGIRGKSGGGREAGGACVSLSKKERRAANFPKGWQR